MLIAHGLHLRRAREAGEMVSVAKVRDHKGGHSDALGPVRVLFTVDVGMTEARFIVGRSRERVPSLSRELKTKIQNAAVEVNVCGLHGSNRISAANFIIRLCIRPTRSERQQQSTARTELTSSMLMGIRVSASGAGQTGPFG